MPECSVDLCGGRAIARQLCSKHYWRWRRNGDPVKGRVAPGVLVDWLKSHSTHLGSECLQWPFARNESGYGAVSFGGVRTLASRAMCIIAHGEPPSPTSEAAHSCGRGASGCVNPAHLRWASPRENSADRLAHGTSNRGERNGFSKLSEHDISEIRRLRGQVPRVHLAKRFGVSAGHVTKIQAGGSWEWLGGGRC